MSNIIYLNRLLRWNAAVAAYKVRSASGVRFLSVCSGIEAASVAFGPIGWKPIAFAEIEKFPSAVLAHHYPDIPNLGDFTKIDTTQLGRVDVLCGGTPCQAFSVAGARRGLNDARGNLTLAFVELAHELADGNGLRNVIYENVPGILSDKTNAFGCLLAGLVGANSPIVTTGRWSSHGMVAGPKARVAWAIKDAQFHGLAQRRKRVILVADFGNGADPAAVLFEPESVRRDSPPSRETGQGIAAAASKGAGGGGGLGTDFDLDGGLVNAYGGNRTTGPLDVATAVNAHGGPHGRLDFESETFVVGALPSGGTVRGHGVSGVNNQAVAAGHVIPVCFSAKDYGADASIDIAPTLRAGGHTGSHANAGVMPAICQTVALRGRDGGATAELGGDVATALRASSGGGDKPHVLAFHHNAQACQLPGPNRDCSISDPLTRSQNAAVAFTRAVRRLTPRECERLQGFPDDYTLIPWRNRPADQCPDGPRYKALGNSWAVPLFNWLGRRIASRLP